MARKGRLLGRRRPQHGGRHQGVRREPVHRGGVPDAPGKLLGTLHALYQGEPVLPRNFLRSITTTRAAPSWASGCPTKHGRAATSTTPLPACWQTTVPPAYNARAFSAEKSLYHCGTPEHLRTLRCSIFTQKAPADRGKKSVGGGSGKCQIRGSGLSRLRPRPDCPASWPAPQRQAPASRAGSHSGQTRW